MMEAKRIDTVEFAKALADETRQKIMAICCCRELSVNEIVEMTEVAQPTVSHHLSILKNAGLVKVERRGKQIFYTLNQARLAQACCNVAEHFAPEVEVKIIKID
jgi:ArsR family transcriptional regulator